MLANSATTTRRLGALLAFFALTFGLLAGPLALIAHADGNASAFVVEANLAKDGTLKVKQTITFTGAVPPELSQKFETRENLVGDRQYVQTLSDITASVKGAAVTPKIETDDRFTTVTVATNGATEVMMGYTVTGAVVTIEGGETALRWGLLQGLSAQVAEFAATVQIPTQFTYIKCTAGAPNSDVPCDVATAGTEGSQIPTFRDGPRGEGESRRGRHRLPGQHRRQQRADRLPLDRRSGLLGRAAATGSGPGPAGAGRCRVCSCCTGAQASMRRPGDQITRAGEFVPTGAGQTEFRVVDDVRPGHVGTVADERVDPIDVTATLVDLAVRGHLLITELPRETEFARRRLDADPHRCPGR